MKKHYDQMTAPELREATREFDHELPVGPDSVPGRPMNAADSKRWQSARKKMGRPPIGKGVKRIMICLEADLLKSTDQFAKRHHINRSQMISAGLKKLMEG